MIARLWPVNAVLTKVEMHCIFGRIEWVDQNAHAAKTLPSHQDVGGSHQEREGVEVIPLEDLEARR